MWQVVIGTIISYAFLAMGYLGIAIFKNERSKYNFLNPFLKMLVISGIGFGGMGYMMYRAFLDIAGTLGM